MALSHQDCWSLQPYETLVHLMCINHKELFSGKKFGQALTPRDFIMRIHARERSNSMIKIVVSVNDPRNMRKEMEAVYIYFYNASFHFKIRPSLGWTWPRFLRHFFLREYMTLFKSSLEGSTLALHEQSIEHQNMKTFFRIFLPPCNIDRLLIPDDCLKDPMYYRTMNFILPSSTRVLEFEGPFLMVFHIFAGHTGDLCESIYIFRSEEAGIFQLIGPVLLPLIVQDVLISPKNTYVAMTYFQPFENQTTITILNLRNLQLYHVPVPGMTRKNTFDFAYDHQIVCNTSLGSFYTIDCRYPRYRLHAYSILSMDHGVPTQHKTFMIFGACNYIFPYNFIPEGYRHSIVDRFIWYNSNSRRTQYILFPHARIMSMDSHDNECLLLVRSAFHSKRLYKYCTRDEFLKRPHADVQYEFYQYHLYRCNTYKPGHLIYVNVNLPYCMERFEDRFTAWQQKHPDVNNVPFSLAYIGQHKFGHPDKMDLVTYQDYVEITLQTTQATEQEDLSSEPCVKEYHTFIVFYKERLKSRQANFMDKTWHKRAPKASKHLILHLSETNCRQGDWPDNRLSPTFRLSAEFIQEILRGTFHWKYQLVGAYFYNVWLLECQMDFAPVQQHDFHAPIIV